MTPRDRLEARVRTRRVLLAVAVTGAAMAAGCTVRDEEPAFDSGVATEVLPADAGAPAVAPEPLPTVGDTTTAPPTAARRNLPPVAGETKKPIDDRRERDSVTEPRFEVGPDGKMRPIRR